MGLYRFQQFTKETAHSGGSDMKSNVGGSWGRLSSNLSPKWALYSLMALTYASCAPSLSAPEQNLQSEQKGIIGGQQVDTSFAQKNGVVGIVDLSKGGICTGSLLPNSIVLTAGHCVSNNAKAILVVFDSDLMKAVSLLKENRIEELLKIARPVTVAAVNPEYANLNTRIRSLVEEKFKEMNTTNPTDAQKGEIVAAIGELKDHGDIALLKFKGEKPVGYSEASFLSNQAELATGKDVVLSGYGLDNGKDNTGSGVLRVVDNIKIANGSFASTEVLLDQTQGKGACRGDSGGPAFIKVTENGETKLKLWGVTSRGYRDRKNDCTQFSVYTNSLAWGSWLADASKRILELEASANTKTK